MIYINETHPSEQKIGLLCGGGQFPIMVAEGVKRAGHDLVVIAIRGLADPGLEVLADEVHWTGLLRLGQWIRIFQRRGCRRAILAGAVRKADMYNYSGLHRVLQFSPDWTSLKVWYFKLLDKQPATVLTAITDEFADRGIQVEDCTMFTPDALAQEGCWTMRQPNAAQEADIEFGWRIAKQLSDLDIGQSMAVKERDVIAVEAIEGTDQMIARAGALCPSGGWCFVKVSRPQQDMRFDVPTIGPGTIERLHQHGAKVLCVEAGKTVVVELPKVIALADRYGIVLTARRSMA